MLERIRNHFEILFKGSPAIHYKKALGRRLIKLRLRWNKDGQLVFCLYRNVKGILREDDSLALWAYFYGLDSVILQTLEGYLKPGMVVVDVGANVGLYSLICASLVGKDGMIYALEPVPWLAQRAQENAKLNSMTNIKTFNIALGSRLGVSKLYLSKFGNEWSSLYRWELTRAQYIDVKVIPLDEWIQENSIKSIDLMKVDVEGSEIDIFSGAQGALKKGIINAIIVEYNQQTQRAGGFSGYDLCQSLARFGFDWYRLPYAGNQVTPVDWSRLPKLCDLLAIK